MTDGCSRCGSKKGIKMNRALYSGVAGLKAHQTKMDVIGNNISNVNTYGYKSQRAVFSDVFYQTVASATAGTASKGGTNPSSIGYGSQLAAIQTKMSQSSMQSTGYGLDVAITGEGFFQVMDADGNIFYTKAGLLDYDANGYLTDVNGNFVLGAAKADGAAASEKIKIDNLGAVPSAASKADVTINGIKYTITASNATESGNISIAIGSSDDLPAGQKATATISTTGTVTVKLSSTEKFTDIASINAAINAAITEANGGKAHAAGSFNIAAPDAATKFPAGGLTGKEICGTDYSVTEGTITGDPIFGGLMTINGTSSDFTGSGTVNPSDFTAAYTAASGGNPAFWTISMTVGAKTYSGVLKDGELAKSLLLKSSAGDYIEVTNPDFSQLVTQVGDADTDGVPDLNVDTDLDGTPDVTVLNALAMGDSLTVSPATQSNELGLSSVSFSLVGGTKGGAVTLDQLTSIAIGSDGVLSVTHADLGTVTAGRISLANFANPAGLQMKGSNYFTQTTNSGKPILCNPGSSGTGELQSNTLELSNVDLSSEFAEMITTQRGFQANSRIITVSDTMLEELINLKR